MLIHKFKIRLLFLFFLLCCQATLIAQTHFKLQGEVFNTKAMPIALVKIEVMGCSLKTVTDEKGRFELLLPKDRHVLRFQQDRYALAARTIRLSQDSSFQIILQDTLQHLDEVVITATRTSKLVSQIPLPITVIRKEEMQQKGMVRLQELLAEQTGIVLFQDHGTGVQLQGFDPKYTLILLDGEPIIGRTSGTLELSRVTLSNVDRVEIIKGPSSSLYGSEAMAGVINIISKSPAKGRQFGASMRYGTHQALDLSVDGSYSKKKTTLYGAFNRYSNQGYSYTNQQNSKTVPPFYAYTGQLKWNYQLLAKLGIQLGLKYNEEHNEEDYLSNTGKNDQLVNSKFMRREFSVSPQFTFQPSKKHRSFLRIHKTFYETDTKIHILESNNLHHYDFFDQGFAKAELQHDYHFSDWINLTAGAGFSQESMKAQRYEEEQKFNTGFLYGQIDMQLFKRLNLIAGARYDSHNVYASHLSPKLAAQYQLLPWLTAFGSIGRGFKAPEFRELYLNWNNPTQGYSVFGSETALLKLKQLQEAGEIAEQLFDPSNMKALATERSWNYQAGLKFPTHYGLSGSINYFNNQICNLIETFALATKTNGKSVYSYSNQKEVSINGLEANVTYSYRQITLKVSGQYLKTANKEVLQALNEGKTYYMRDAETGHSRVVQKSEYGGLLNRSRYTMNSSLSYHWASLGLSYSFRWTYRNRFGLRDLDGNGILNRDDEYGKGYSMFNSSLVKTFYQERLSLILSSENLGDIKHTGIASMPGRQFFVGISFRSKKYN